jgi:peptidoglycan/LPS O-acetylase OafA/YrhL
MKISYRPEIDGMRAVSILAVIIYHARIYISGEPFLKGGFLGVDIFFIVSGYLIASILIKEKNLNGNISIKNFFIRRARRILPLLFFVAIITLFLGYFFLLPPSLIDNTKTILSSIFFFSNYFLFITGQEYGAESGLLIPFLHTWSLSIEEQFYIFFPFFIFFINGSKKRIILTICIICLSIIFSHLLSSAIPQFNFYNTISRIWEFLLGALAAELYLKNKIKNFNKSYPAEFITLASSITILIYFIFFSEDISHPSFYTLPFCLAVISIILFVNKKNLTFKLLSSNILVKIGLISYSLYLFHYVVFSYSRIIDYTKGDIVKKIFLALIVFLLSVLSYYVIEKPFRDKKIISNKKLASYLIFFLLIIVLTSIFYLTNNGFEKRLPNILKNTNQEKTWLLLKDKNNKICYNRTPNKKTNEFCIFNSIDSSKTKVFLIGDSVMASLSYSLKDHIIKRNFEFIPITAGGCIYLPNFNTINLQTNKIIEHCNAEYQNKIRDLLLSNPNSIIIFGGEYPVYLSGEFFDNEEGGKRGDKWNLKLKHFLNIVSIEEGIKESITELSINNKIILVYPIPQVGFDPKKRIFSYYKLNTDNNNYQITTKYEAYKKFNSKTFKTLDNISNENIYRIYPHKLFCDNQIPNKCIVNDKADIFYYDDHHPSLKGSEIINELIIKKIDEIAKIKISK